jgi:formylglycine-generating enzyme required for sulfatase activity
MRGKLWILGAAVTAVIAQEPAPKGPARYAFVVTNEKYAPLASLPASSKDGDTVENALRTAGFKVTRVRDFKQEEFYVKYETPFLKQIQPGDICLFYYSGYTAKVDYDDSYLLPIDFNPNDSNNMEERAVHLSRLPEDFDGKKSGLKIIVVEPKQPGVQVRRATPGLIDAMLEGTQTLFAFAWPPEESATAHPGVEAGLFTKSLVSQIAKPGRNLKEVFDAVRNEVGGETKGVQVPYTKDNLFGKEFLFHEKLPEPPKPVVTKKDEIQPGVPFSDRQDREEYVWIPPGHFNMGCVANDKNCEKDESPRHPVTITKGFWMGQTEVTVNAYTRFAQDKKSKSMPPKPNYGYKSTDQPIVDVSWDQAKEFCEWVGGRLPTEAEWEYAARGNIDGEINGLGDNAREKANFYGTKGNDKFDAAAPVKQFDRNGFQLYDMLGNVWEWVNDVYDPMYYSQAPAGQNVVDPPGPAMGKDHVMRGGSWDSDPNKHLRLSIRRPGKAENNVGMRCVMDESPATRTLLGR